jgi:hypothetical protein
MQALEKIDYYIFWISNLRTNNDYLPIVDWTLHG